MRKLLVTKIKLLGLFLRIIVVNNYLMVIKVLSSCIGCGICTTLCPRVFEIYKNFAVANSNFVSDNESKCIDAAINCPVNAIIIDY